MTSLTFNQVITDPQRADEIAATIMRQNEQGASINESEETTSPDAEVTTTLTTSEVNSEEYSDNDHLPATETDTLNCTTDEGDTDCPYFELKQTQCLQIGKSLVPSKFMPMAIMFRP